MKNILDNIYNRATIIYGFEDTFPKEVKIVKGKALQKYLYYNRIAALNNFDPKDCKNDVIIYVKDQNFNVKILGEDSIYTVEFMLFHNNEIYINKKTKTMEIFNADLCNVRIIYFTKNEKFKKAEFFMEFSDIRRKD